MCSSVIIGLVFHSKLRVSRNRALSQVGDSHCLIQLYLLRLNKTQIHVDTTPVTATFYLLDCNYELTSTAHKSVQFLYMCLFSSFILFIRWSLIISKAAILNITEKAYFVATWNIKTTSEWRLHESEDHFSVQQKCILNFCILQNKNLSQLSSLCNSTVGVLLTVVFLHRIQQLQIRCKIIHHRGRWVVSTIYENWPGQDYLHV